MAAGFAAERETRYTNAKRESKKNRLQFIYLYQLQINFSILDIVD